MSQSPCRFGVLTFGGLLLLSLAPTAHGDARISGHGRFERIKGKPQAGYVELYETNLFLTPPSQTTVGVARRLGTSCYSGGSCSEAIITGDGCFCRAGLASGVYAAFVNQPLFFVAPKVVHSINLPDNVITTVNPELPIDFSTFYKDNWMESGSSTWYQTFIATGISIRGVAFSYAGPNPAAVNVAILRDNGNPNPANWTHVHDRTDGSVADVTDNWVRFRSVDCPTLPGTRYAVRLSAINGNIQPYRRAKDANSYTGGQAYNISGTPLPYDFNITVFSDNDGTVVTMNKREQGVGELREGNFRTAWGQTFTAIGNGLAGVDCWAAGANHNWNLDFRWQIKQGGPAGAQIGPTRITGAAFQGAGAGLHGVAYNPGEVPLTPGQTYFVQFTIHNPPGDSNGFNPYIMDNDSYGGGIGYRFEGGATWTAMNNDDVSMTVVEYALPTPIIELNKSVINRDAVRGANLSSDSFTVRNVGSGTLNYGITDNAAWLSVSPPSGSSTGEADTITVNYDVAELPLGPYQATITVADPAALNTPRLITVNVTVASVKPDFDDDFDVDLDDFAHLQNCLTGGGNSQNDPACLDARLDGDEDVDADDFTIFAGCLSGKGEPAVPTCAG